MRRAAVALLAALLLGTGAGAEKPPSSAPNDDAAIASAATSPDDSHSTDDASEKRGFVEPRALAMVSPSYPTDAVDADLTGSVVVCFTVTDTGSVVDAYVLSSTHAMFEASAVRAGSESTFEPATQTGRPVSHHMCLRYRFRL